jgi:hypothetical protein
VPQRDGLRRRGVLVLVQQHDPEGRPQRRRDLRHLLRQPGRDGHLVGELDQPQASLQLLVVQHQAGQLEPLLGRDDGLLHVGVGVAVAVGRCRLPAQQHLPRLGVQRLRRHQVRLQLGVQLEHALGDAGRAQPRQELEGAGGRLDHPGRQPVAGGPADHRRVGLVAEPQPVLRHQPRGERVVGHHQLLAGLVHAAVGDDPGLEQRRPDPCRQLGGGLAGEGEAEHLPGPDGTGPDQPDHPGRHHRRLARPRARDDDPRLQRSGDRVELLRGEADAERLDEVGGVPQPAGRGGWGQQVDAHATTCWPADWVGQLPRKGQ